MGGGAYESGTMFWCKHLASWNLSTVLIHKPCCGSQTVPAQLAVAPSPTYRNWATDPTANLCCVSNVTQTCQWPSQSLNLSLTPPHFILKKNGIKWDIGLCSTPKRCPVWFPTLTLSPKEHSARRYHILNCPMHTEHQITPNIILLIQSIQQSTLNTPTAKQSYDPPSTPTSILPYPSVEP